MPGIIGFLGYNPLPEATTLTRKLVRHRTSLGMSKKKAAAALGVDQGTLARWEREESGSSSGECLRRVRGFLKAGQLADARSAG